MSQRCAFMQSPLRCADISVVSLNSQIKCLQVRYGEQTDRTNQIAQLMVVQLSLTALPELQHVGPGSRGLQALGRNVISSVSASKPQL